LRDGPSAPPPAFHPAEAYHQNHVALNPGQPQVVLNDLPKLARLRKQSPELYDWLD
jgi:peptide-methionine (S)-S-oxide reductase